MSTVVRTDWQGGGNKISVELMNLRAHEAIWLHGYKDPELYRTTKRHLLTNQATRPTLTRFELSHLQFEESVRRKGFR